MAKPKQKLTDEIDEDLDEDDEDDDGYDDETELIDQEEIGR